MKYKNMIVLSCMLLSVFLSNPSWAQESPHAIAIEVASRQSAFAQQPERLLLKPQAPNGPWVAPINKRVEENAFFTLDKTTVKRLEQDRPQELKLRLQMPDGQSVRLELYQAEYLAPGFELRKSSNPDRIVPFDPGLHYRGIVNGEVKSLAMLLIRQNEVSGLIEYQGRQYNFGKVKETPDVHILYPTEAMIDPPVFGCDASDLPTLRPIDTPLPADARTSDPNKCVKVHVVVDNDVYQDKGMGTESYVSNIFSQVITLYADIQVNMAVGSIFVWDTTDPFTGPSTGAFLNQFEAHLMGNYNGSDIAHLVGYQGDGGIAWQDVLNWCNQPPDFANKMIGYSGIGQTYEVVPTYSWSVNVVTHELGHNLASPHTHDCEWNGDNTPIDNCGPQSGNPGTPDGCADNGVTPPVGTIMSYCHLLGQSSVSFVAAEGGGFHPQVSALIRDKVYNSTCLTPCSTTTNDAGISAIVEPASGAESCGATSMPIVTLKNYGSAALTTVAIQYTLDGGTTQTYNWTGNLASQAQANVTLPTLSLTAGNHTLAVSTANPNGQTDENMANDGATVNFSSNENVSITLTIVLDNFPQETSWNIQNNGNTTVASGGSYSTAGATVSEQICLPAGCYDFTILDSFSDGICCGEGEGSYTLTDNSTGNTLASGGEFAAQETTNFCLTSGGGGGDAGISAIVEPASGAESCGATSMPIVTLRNYGSAALTTVAIQYTLDGGTTQTYNWTGNLASQAQANVTLPTLSLTAGNHTLAVSTANPNGQIDENMANDGATVNFSSNENVSITLTITLDNYPQETSWNIQNNGNTTVASGGNYSTAGATVSEQICLPAGCYDFTIADSEGDGICCAYGEGSYTLTDNSTGNTLASGGEFAAQETTNFCLTSDGGGGTDCAQGAIAVDDNPITSNTYSTATAITSVGTVPSGNTVIFQAAQSVTLQAGFHAQAGSTFTARIADCTPAALAQVDTTVMNEPTGRTPLFTTEVPPSTISMIIMPNPFRNEAIIRYTLEKDLPTQLVLVDMLGRTQVLQPNAIRTAGYQEFRLDGTGLSNGIYFVQLRAGEEIITQRVQVMRN